MIRTSSKKTLPNSPAQKAKKKITTTETSSPKITKPVKTKKAPPKFNESATKLTRSDSFANVLKRKGSSFFGAIPEITGRASLGILSPKRKQATTPFTSPNKNMTSPREQKDKASLIKKLSSFKKGKENSEKTPNKSSSKTSSKESITTEEEEEDDEEFKSPTKVLFSQNGIPNLNLNKVKSMFGSAEDEFDEDFDETTIASIDSPKHDCLTDDTSLKTPRDEVEDLAEAAIAAVKNSFSKKISNSFKYDDDSEEEDEIDGALIDEFGFNVPKNFIVKKNKPEVKVEKKQKFLEKLMSPRGNKNQ